MENQNNQTITEPPIEPDNKNSLAAENNFTANQDLNPELEEEADKPKNLKGPTVLFKESFALYKLRFKTLFGIMLVPFSINILFVTILYLLVSNSKSVLLITTFSFISSITTLLISILSLLALVFQLKEDLGVKDSYKSSFKIFFSYLWTSLLSFLIFFGSYTAIGLIFLLLFFITSSIISFEYTPIVFIISIIFGVIVCFPFIFITFARVIEEIKGMDCLLACEWLVRKKTISVLYRLVILSIFIFPILIIFSFILKKAFTDIYFYNLFINPIASNFLQLILMPISTIYWGLLYEDLKKTKNIYLYSESSKKTKKIYITLACLGVLSPLIILGIFTYIITSS